jgi:orotidine-5'-phosphate decarboxylase
MDHFADRLTEAIRRKKNALCVGLDPRWENLPQAIRRLHGNGSLAGVARAFEEFCGRVLEIVAPLVPVVKLQSAFFEAGGAEGMAVQGRLLKQARALGVMTILDAKRNDIASTATAYADAAFAGSPVDGATLPVWNADALTVNPYLGRDAVEPFLQSARASARGVFVLVRTSNPGAGLFQDLLSDGKAVYEHVAAAVAGWGEENLGRGGLSDVGAVVGATYPEEMAGLRKLLPRAFFLVPGFGAQGAGARDAAAAFRPDGLGAIVNSSRGIIFAFPKDSPTWEEEISRAATATIDVLARETPMGELLSQRARPPIK